MKIKTLKFVTHPYRYKELLNWTKTGSSFKKVSMHQIIEQRVKKVWKFSDN